MIDTTNTPQLTFGYTNHRGEYAVRQAIPLRVEYRVSEWHGDQPQHIMVGWDVEKQAERDFLIEDMVPLGNLRKRFERITAENDLIEALAATLSAQHVCWLRKGQESLVRPWESEPDHLKEFYRDQAVAARDFMTAHFAGPAATHNSEIGNTISDSKKPEPETDGSSQPQDILTTAMDNFVEWVMAIIQVRNATPERVLELLEANNRYLEDVRAARSTTGAALLLAETWRAHGNELAGDILRGVLAGEIEPQSDMVKHSAPGAARCVGPIEEGLRKIRVFMDDEGMGDLAMGLIDSLLEHNFPNPDAPAAEPKVEPVAASDQPEYRDQREHGEFGEGMNV
jgi:hypothetical protein